MENKILTLSIAGIDSLANWLEISWKAVSTNFNFSKIMQSGDFIAIIYFVSYSVVNSVCKVYVFIT